jgi:hypothetical protein
MLRASLALVAAAAALAVPTSAHAVEGFAGVTESGSLVRFTTEAPYALTAPRSPRGLAPGERLVALGKGARGVVGVGSSARLYAVDPVSARATPIGAPFPQGLRGSRFSLAVAPKSDRARLLSDVGQDLKVDLLTGATENGPGLRRARDGAPVRPAADATPDGALVGIQLNPGVLLRELASNTTTMAEMPLADQDGIGLGEPASFQLGEDGRGYAITVAVDRRRSRQSTFLAGDPSTGRPAPPVGLAFRTFARRLNTFTALGRVSADTARPRARVGVPRNISARVLLRNRIPLLVRSNEAGQVTASLRVGGQRVGFTFANRDTPGLFQFTNFVLGRRDAAIVRRGIGSTVRIVVGVNDLKGNRRTFVRTARLTR